VEPSTLPTDTALFFVFDMLFSQVGLLGLLIAIGFVVQSNKNGEHKTTTFEKSVDVSLPSTPTKTSTPLNQKTGSVHTPAGRRSARLAKRRKED
jgi:hypothetical protein